MHPVKRIAPLALPILLLFLPVRSLPGQEPLAPNPYEQLMQRALVHASKFHALKPALSPMDSTVASYLPVAGMQRKGIEVIPWTTENADTMRTLIRTGVNGIISDRPDILQRVLNEERTASAVSAEKLKAFNVAGRHGARGLRPENTLPAIEAGLDNLVNTIEVDTGVSADGISVLWHDPVFNPSSCRRADKSAYTEASAVPLFKISFEEIQRTFICDRTGAEAGQKNDLSLSPVSSAFAKEQHLANPYTPVSVEQLFRFAAFYAKFYRSGAGADTPHAAQRAAAAERVRFLLMTRVLPVLQPRVLTDPSPSKVTIRYTPDPQDFVTALCGVVRRNHMDARSAIESFDFRTLLMVEEQCPSIQTIYVTVKPLVLSDITVPAELRVVQVLP